MRFTEQESQLRLTFLLCECCRKYISCRLVDLFSIMIDLRTSKQLPDKTFLTIYLVNIYRRLLQPILFKKPRREFE